MADIFSDFFQGYQQGRTMKMVREINQLRLKQLKSEMDLKEKALEARQSLLGQMQPHQLPADQLGPTSPGQTLQQLVKTPQGQALLLQSGMMKPTDLYDKNGIADMIAQLQLKGGLQPGQKLEVGSQGFTYTLDPAMAARVRNEQNRNVVEGNVLPSGRILPGMTPKQQQELTAKRAAEEPVDKANLTNIDNALARMEQSVDQLIKNPDLKYITGVMAPAGYIPGKLSTARTDLESLKSKVFNNVYNELRNASKTGGGLGNMAVPEMENIMRFLGSLESVRDYEGLLRTLKDIKAYSQRTRMTAKTKFKDTYGYVPTLEQAQPDASMSPEQIRAAVQSGAMTREEGIQRLRAQGFE